MPMKILVHETGEHKAFLCTGNGGPDFYTTIATCGHACRKWWVCPCCGCDKVENPCNICARRGRHA